MNASHKGRILILAAALCWSSAGAIVKLCAEALNGYQISGLRSVFAFLFFFIMVRPWRLKRFLPSLPVFLLSISYATMLILYVRALTLTTAASAIFLQDTAPIWILLLAPWVLKEKFRWRDLCITLVCGVGMLLFFLDELSFSQQKGNVLALISGIAYAIVMLGLRWGRPKGEVKKDQKPIEKNEPSNAELIVLWGNGLCVLFCIPWLLELPPFETAMVPLLWTALLGVVQLGLGYFLLTKGIQHVPAAEATLLTLLEPIANPIWAYLTFGDKELPGTWAMCGAMIVLLGLASLGVLEMKTKNQNE